MDTVGSAKAYLEILRQCAVHFRSFGQGLRSALASSPCVLGWQHDPKGKSEEVRGVRASVVLCAFCMQRDLTNDELSDLCDNTPLCCGALSVAYLLRLQVI